MAETLRDLLMQAKKKRDVTSGRALAELTSGREDKIDRTQVNHILNGTYRHRPGHGAIRAIAWLAGVPEDRAYEAAGLPVQGPSFADELPPDVNDLSPQQRHAVITVIRTFLGSADKGGVERDGSAAKKLPTLGESLPERRRKALEQGLPQKRAAYDGDTPDDDKSPD